MVYYSSNAASLCMHNFTNNSDKSPLEVVPTPSIFSKDRLMRLKRERLGPIIDPKEGRREWPLAQATEAKDEDDNPRPLTWKKGKKIATPRKGKQAAPGFWSASKRAKEHFAKFHQYFLSYSFWYC